MRSAARGTLLLVLSAPAWVHAQTPAPLVPKAVVRGQASVPAGGTVILDARDSICDANQPLQWHAVEPTDLVLITADKGDRKDALAFFVTDSRKGARYTVAVTAVAVDPLTRKVAVDTDLYSVEAEPPVPPPPPTPTPGPMPVPNPTPTPTPVSDAHALGLKFGPALGATYGDAWLAAATALEQGRTVAEAQKILQDTWKNTRTAAFVAQVKPVFEAILPEGTEPGDAAKRAAIVRTWRDFGAGLKGVTP